MQERELWNNWVEEKHYGELFFKRATGVLEEMESSKSISKLIQEIYQENDKVLDVGCGAGHYLKSLRRIISDNVDYTGIDPTEYYIQLARKAYGNDSMFKVGSVFEIPEADNSFDIVMCNNVVMHLPPERLAEAFSELIRVSRKAVIIRAMFGERNYIVKEVLSSHDMDPTTGDGIEPMHEDLTQSKFRYFNMYTQEYYEELIHRHPGLSVECKADTDWKDFDNTGDSKINTGTRTLGDFQVSGNLILDWRYIIINKI